MKILISGLSLLFAVAVLSVLTGCAAREQTAALQEAREVYAAAQNKPEVVANAPVLLHEAGQTLEQAAQAEDRAEQEHLAYLAQQKARMAVTVGERQAAQKSVAQLEDQRQELLLQARQQETAQARQRAEAREEELTETRQQMQARERALEEARRTAQAREQALAEARGEVEARQRALEEAKRSSQAQSAEMEQLQKELSQLQAETKQTKRGVVLTLSEILFPFGKAELMPGATPILGRVANFLENHPEQKIEILGHTDSVGNADYNQELSRRRAEAVAASLQQAGIEPARIVTKGMGEKFPVASNDFPGGRQQNRRVEIIFLNGKMAAASR